MKRLTLTALLLSALNISAAAEIRVALTGDRAPYSFKKNGIDSGIEIDIIRAALKQFGHTIQPIIVPKARLAIILKDRKADMSATIQGVDGDGLFFSDAYISFHNYAISKKIRGVELKQLSDVDKYSFIIWQGGWKNLGPRFEFSYKPDNTGKFPFNYHEVHSQLNQSKMFWADRADLIIVDKAIFEHLRTQLRNEFNTAEPVVFHDILKSHTSYPAAFHDKELRDQFNLALKKMQADGSYQAILDAYK